MDFTDCECRIRLIWGGTAAEAGDPELAAPAGPAIVPPASNLMCLTILLRD
jgi:hypothetical protein